MSRPRKLRPQVRARAAELVCVRRIPAVIIRFHRTPDTAAAITELSGFPKPEIFAFTSGEALSRTETLVKNSSAA
jgi:hypothetical protein